MTMTTEQFQDFLAGRVAASIQMQPEIDQSLANNDPDTLVDLGWWKYHRITLSCYCDYVETHDTDHGLVAKLGRDMEKIITRDALRRIIEEANCERAQ